MTGPEHYQQAQYLLKLANEGMANWEPTVASAQVHATLALAAATALMQRPEPPQRDWFAWFNAAAAKPGKNEEASA
jgi:hypothetical protein